MRNSRSWWARSASLIFLVVAFGFAVKANGKVREGQGLAVATCTTGAFVNGYPPGDNPGVCSTPGFANIGGTITDAQLANAYSGVGSCAAHNFATTLTRNAAPTCSQPLTTDLADVSVTPGCTWTPSDQSGASLTFSNVSVSCLRFGNLVSIYGRLTFPNTASNAQATIGGLPFSVANQTYAQNGQLITTTANATIVGIPIANTTEFEIFTAANVGAVTNATLSTQTIEFWINFPRT